MAIHKLDKGTYFLIKADSGKLKVKGFEGISSSATEFKDQPREYEEVLNVSEEEEEGKK